MSHLTFTQALALAESQARARLDVALHARLACAVSLVEGGRVFQTAGGDWQVDSASTEGLVYTVNGTCSCKDAHYQHPPQGLCKHRIAVYLARRAQQLLAQPPPPVVPAVVEPWPDNDVEGDEPAPVPAAPAPPPAPEAPGAGLHGLDPRHLVLIQGKPFVKFAGLLDLAHQRGLQSLTVAWTYNDAELSLAAATAVFPFGTFQEAGDATPTNVNKKVAPHFRRCALTRAAARVLRDALNCDMVSLEELADD